MKKFQVAFVAITILVIIFTGCDNAQLFQNCENCLSPRKCIKKEGKLQCVACESSADCTFDLADKESMLCDKNRNICLCKKDSACPGEGKCDADGKCYECTRDTHCPKNKPFCGRVNPLNANSPKECRSCTQDSHCQDSKKPFCIEGRCSECKPNTEESCSSAEPKACGKAFRKCRSDGVWQKCTPEKLCEDGQICENSICKTRPNCGNGQIDNGETCKTCPQDIKCLTGQVCSNEQQEEYLCCLPNCRNKSCGSDGCGGQCGSCPDGQECNTGKCENKCGNGRIDDDENCSNCPADASCKTDFACNQAIGKCVALCGNGKVDTGENCNNCSADVKCKEAQKCFSDRCCSPNCIGKQCGSDGCGGTCGGTCKTGNVCNNGNCVPSPVCGNGKQEPGETCDSCPKDVKCKADESCTNNKCIPKCGNGIREPTENCKNCPKDSPCSSGFKCSPTGNCCKPNCTGKTCGPDGCGGSCGSCGNGQACNTIGKCVQSNVCKNGIKEAGENCLTCIEDAPCKTGETCEKGVCKPRCGNGHIDSGETCNTCKADVCTNSTQTCFQNKCCTPNCSGKTCGPNGCGGSCGTCQAGTSCNLNTNQCAPPCGNGRLDSGENCKTCPADAGCRSNQFCNETGATPICSDFYTNIGAGLVTSAIFTPNRGRIDTSLQIVGKTTTSVTVKLRITDGSGNGWLTSNRIQILDPTDASCPNFTKTLTKPAKAEVVLTLDTSCLKVGATKTLQVQVVMSGSNPCSEKKDCEFTTPTIKIRRNR